MKKVLLTLATILLITCGMFASNTISPTSAQYYAAPLYLAQFSYSCATPCSAPSWLSNGERYAASGMSDPFFNSVSGTLSNVNSASNEFTTVWQFNISQNLGTTSVNQESITGTLTQQLGTGQNAIAITGVSYNASTYVVTYYLDATTVPSWLSTWDAAGLGIYAAGLGNGSLNLGYANSEGAAGAGIMLTGYGVSGGVAYATVAYNLGGTSIAEVADNGTLFQYMGSYRLDPIFGSAASGSCFNGLTEGSEGEYPNNGEVCFSGGVFGMTLPWHFPNGTGAGFSAINCVGSSSTVPIYETNYRFLIWTFGTGGPCTDSYTGGTVEGDIIFGQELESGSWHYIYGSDGSSGSGTGYYCIPGTTYCRVGVDVYITYDSTP